MSHKYTIIDTADMTGSKWDDVIESEATASTPCNDGSQRIVKWTGPNPSWIASLGLPVYNNTIDLFAAMPAEDWESE